MKRHSEYCYRCNKVGHIKLACKTVMTKVKNPRPNNEEKASRSRKYGYRGRIKELCEEDDAQNVDAWEDMYKLTDELNSLDDGDPIMLDVKLNSKPVKMELDTGAAVSVISDKDYNRYMRHNIQLCPTTKSLKTYTGQRVRPKGVCQVNVTYEGQQHTLPLYILDGEGPPLMGRQWLKYIQLNWSLLKLGEENKTLQEILSKHKDVFSEGLGKLKGIKSSFTFEGKRYTKVF